MVKTKLKEKKMKKFIREYCKKKNIKAVHIGSRLYILEQNYIGSDVGMLIPTHCKKEEIKKNRFFYKPFSKDEEGDQFYLLDIKDKIDILKNGKREEIEIVDFFSEFFSEELNKYLYEKLWKDYIIPESRRAIEKTVLTEIAINIIHKYNCNFEKIWKKIWSIKNATFGVDRQIESIDERLKEFVCSRRCGGGISARDWEVRVFPVFRAVLREMQEKKVKYNGAEYSIVS